MRLRPIFGVIVSGILVLVIVMGIGRFAYTPILPIMKTALNLTDTFMGILAASNFLGYLLGALFAGLINWRKSKKFYIRLFLVINILSTIAMGMVEYQIVWFLLRFLSGLTSGLVFVFASSIVMDQLVKIKKVAWSGIFYSGVGFGIVITGVFVPLLNTRFGWEGTWIGIGIVALLLAAFVFLWLKDSMQTENPIKHTQLPSSRKSNSLYWLIASYGCEGIGYIIIGTFLVAIVEQIPSLSSYPSISWIIAGGAAIPSCLIWALVAKKIGNIKTLQILFFLQIIAVSLPIFQANMIGALLSAFLFGATFMGITTIFVTEARSILPNQSTSAIGYLTFVYGVGQMIGPILSGMLIELTGNYDGALLFSGITLGLGMLLLFIYRLKRDEETGSLVQSQ